MKHHIANYALGGLALVVGLGGALYNEHQVASLPVARVSPMDWPGLSDQQSQDLTAKLAVGVPEAFKTKTIDILCLPPGCTSLAQDFQYAAYQADLPTSYNIPIMGNPTGITISPDDEGSRAIATAFAAATGLTVTVLGGQGTEAGYTLAIGTRP